LLLQVVAAYNADPAVHGILVQLPLPRHIDEQRVLDAISIEKDVDGFHPLNIGRLAMRGRDPLFVPCTPKGCLELLKRSGVALAGKKAAVVGRSNIVGMPAALLLQREDATVTVIHSRTPDAQRICAEADIIIAACGRAEMVGGDWVKEGAAVIDVGINAVDVSTAALLQPCLLLYVAAAAALHAWCCCCLLLLLLPPVAAAAASCCCLLLLLPACLLASLPACLPACLLACLPKYLLTACLPPLPAWAACPSPRLQDPSAKRGYRLVGDVNFAEASEKAACITPVPGGVGPMTIAMLLRNCVDGAARAFAAEQQ
jgi:5,10-methylene-tetrahydrofolate dehydrogenase/methenyl tetrahydrofolate cyclohydrolase